MNTTNRSKPTVSGPGPDLERRLGQVLGVALELGQVLLHPVLHVVLAHEMPDVALAVLGAAARSSAASR